MLEIKLTGTEAVDYLCKESSTMVKFNALQKAYDKLYEKYERSKVSQVEETSHHIEDQSQLLKDVKTSKPGFVKASSYKEHKKDVPGEIGAIVPQGNKTYTQGDLGVIKAALLKSPNNNDRSIQVVAAKLGRTESALRSKLNELGLTTKKNIIYKRP